MSTPEHEMLFALDEPIVMFPRAWEETRSKARYRGWKELDAVGMIDLPFDPRVTKVTVRWLYRYTADPWAELSHRYGDPMTPGAYECWVVEINGG